jgi:hypothetical protein
MTTTSTLSQATISLFVGLAALFLNVTPAQALPWVLNPDSQVLTNPVTPLTGGFTLDNESLGSPTVTVSNVMVASLMFSAVDVINIDTASGVTAIDWLDSNNNLLSLVFNSPLTPSGGTIALDEIASSFTPFNSSVPGEITGSVTAVPEPLTLLGASTAIALGGLFKRRRG